MAKGPQHERYAAWLERRRGPRDTKDETELLAIADAYDEALQNGMLTTDQLQRVVDGASSPRALLWSNATHLLMKLSGKWQTAAEAIAIMFRSRKAHIRFAALCSLGRTTPIALTDELIKLGLCDKSASVRAKAVSRADQLERRNLVSAIEAALAAEHDDKTRNAMELDLRMMRDGYWVRPDSPGWLLVTVRIQNGIRSRLVSQDELGAKGLETVLAEIHRSPYP